MKLLYLDIAVSSCVAVLGKNTGPLCQVGPHIQRYHLTTFVRKVGSSRQTVWQIRFSSRPPVLQIRIYFIRIRMQVFSESGSGPVVQRPKCQEKKYILVMIRIQETC
jgi:hypothetical protein